MEREERRPRDCGLGLDDARFPPEAHMRSLDPYIRSLALVEGRQDVFWLRGEMRRNDFGP